MHKHKYGIAFLCWMLFITFLSLSSFSGMDTPDIKVPHFDKFVHFTFYFVAAIFGSLFVREYASGTIAIDKTLGIIFLFCVLYGIIIEVLQYAFTVDREGDIWDALANSLGAFTGLLILKILFSGKRQLKWKI